MSRRIVAVLLATRIAPALCKAQGTEELAKKL